MSIFFWSSLSGWLTLYRFRMSLISDFFSFSFSVIKVSVETLRVLNFVTSRFIYLVMIFLLLNFLDSCFACESDDISPLKQSEIGDLNSWMTQYSGSQNFGGKQFLKSLDFP